MDRRLAGLIAIPFAPWLVLFYPGEVDLVFAWGLLSVDPLRVVWLHEYLFVQTPGLASLPDHLVAWPLSALFYVGAVVNAALSTLDVEDRRVTAGLLLIAAATNLRMWAGLSIGSASAVPLGAILLVIAAWWFHADDLRSMVVSADGR